MNKIKHELRKKIDLAIMESNKSSNQLDQENDEIKLLNKHTLRKKYNSFKYIFVAGFVVSNLILKNFVSNIPFHLYTPLNYGLGIGLTALTNKIYYKYIAGGKKLSKKINKKEKNAINKERIKHLLNIEREKQNKKYYDKISKKYYDFDQCIGALNDKLNINNNENIDFKKIDEEIESGKNSINVLDTMIKSLTDKKVLAKYREDINKIHKKESDINFYPILLALLTRIPLYNLNAIGYHISNLYAIVIYLIYSFVISVVDSIIYEKIYSNEMNALADTEKELKTISNYDDSYSFDYDLKKELDKKIDCEINLDLNNFIREKYSDKHNDDEKKKEYNNELELSKNEELVYNDMINKNYKENIDKLSKGYKLNLTPTLTSENK